MRLLELDLEAKGWSSAHMQAALGCTVTADYFNSRVMMFEPVLEYWTFRAGVIGGGGDEGKPEQRIALQSDQRLDINISHAMIDTMLTAYAHFNETTSQPNDSKIKSSNDDNNDDDDDDDNENDRKAAVVEKQNESKEKFSPYW